MRQLDHTGIYLVIAGSFTAIAGLSLQGNARVGLLVAVWIIAGAGIAYRWLPVVPLHTVVQHEHCTFDCLQ